MVVRLVVFDTEDNAMAADSQPSEAFAGGQCAEPLAIITPGGAGTPGIGPRWWNW